MNMRRMISILATVSMMIFLFASCEIEDTGKGTVRLSITDAPVDTDGIKGVYVTVTEIHYGKSDSEWEKSILDVPKTYDLLELQDGTSELLQDISLNAGTYTQIRFILDVSEAGTEPVTNEGCYLEMEDGSLISLSAPSGAQTGYKAVGSFDVPVNGSVAITADFDARKSVVKAGNSGKYLLKPTIRLIVNDQAGHIAGEVSNIPADKGIMVYAYENGEYIESEAGEPADEEVRFPNAVTSDVVDENNAYYLAYLAPVSYDLVVVSTNEGKFVEVLGIIEGVSVAGSSTTTENIDISDFTE